MINLGASKYGIAAGDCNADGLLNFEDYNLIRDNQGSSASYIPANINFDNATNVTDFLLYENNKSKMAPRFLRY